MKCTVVVPKTTPTVKCEAIKNYGAELIFCEPTPTSRKETCDKIAEEKGFKIIHPYDNYNVIAGQATIAYEMLNVQDFKDLDLILVPISGGGMCSGIALAAKYFNSKIKGVVDLTKFCRYTYVHISCYNFEIALQQKPY